MIMRLLIEKFKKQRRGMTLLLMMVLLSAFLSIGVGIINILLGQVVLVGQSGESFVALYAADSGFERMLYRDRNQNVCAGGCQTQRIFLNGSCYDAVVRTGPSASCPAPNTRCIVSKGQSLCGGNTRYVLRQFEIGY